MPFRLKLLILLLTYCLQAMLLNVGKVNAQQHSYVHYTTFDGLPSQVVYSIIQDSKGFIWLGTLNGLCRFDGKNFKTYTTDDGLPDNEVLQLAEDKQGRIWLSLFNGGACYFKDEKFYWAGNDSSMAQVSGVGNFISYFFPDGEDGFFIYGGRKVYYLSYDLKIKYTYDNFVFGKASSVLQKKNTVVNIGKEITEFKNGIVIKTTQQESLMNDSIKVSNNQKFIDNQVYINIYDSLRLTVGILNNKMELAESKTFHFPYRIDNILKVGNYYFITTLDHVLLRCKTSDIFFSEPEIFLTGNTFNNVLIDKEGALWITSLDNGFYHLPAEGSYTYTTQSGLSDNSIYAIYNYTNEIIFSDSKGNIYNNNPLRKIVCMGDDKIIFRILKMQQVGKFIYVAADRGVYQIDPDNKQATKRIYYGAAKDLFYHNNKIIIACIGGIFSHTISNEAGIDTLLTGRKTNVCVDLKGQLWVGDLEGLYLWKSKNVTINYGAIYKELKTRVTGISLTSDSVLWISTQANGLIGLKNDSLKYHYTKTEGLTTNNLKSVFVYGNKLCLPTDKGVDIVTYSNLSYTIEHYNKWDGLADDDVNSVYIKNDTLYAGTAQGFSIVPLKHNNKAVPPKIYISGFSVNNRDTAFTSKLYLPFKLNNINISYVGLSYASGKNIKYRYKIKDADVWKYTTNTSLTFPGLAPGSYHFTVDAQSSTGMWSSSPATLSFTIRKPFWLENWFIFLLSFTGASVIAYIYYRHQKKLRHDLLLNNNMLQSEIKALRAQMNPHFVFNSLNSIQHFIFSNKKEEANEYLSEFSRLIRMILDNSQNNFITVAEEIEFLTVYLKLEQLRLQHKFNFYFECQADQQIQELLLPSMLLQPFIENAIIHGIAPKKGSAEICISFKLKENGFQCTIEDDGIGLPLQKTESSDQNKLHNDHKSFGIASLTERIKTINQIYNSSIRFELQNRLDPEQNISGAIVTIYFGKPISVIK